MGKDSGLLTSTAAFGSQPGPATPAETPPARAGRATRPEDALLLCCARTRMDSTTAERLRELLREETDWAYLLATAFRHGLLPLLYWQLHATCPERVPPAWMDDLRGYFQRLARRNMFSASALCEVLKKFGADEVAAVPIKGPALAASVYGNLALREFQDLDFLLAEEEVPKARQSLASLGYRPQFPRNDATNAALPRAAGPYRFARDTPRSVVELHSQTTLRHFPVPPDLERLRKRLQPASLGGQKVMTLCPEDLLLFVCVQGARNFWEQLSWICDVSELIGLPGEINWEQLLQAAGRMSCERMFFLGLYLANDLLGALLPEDVARRVRADPVVRLLGAQVRRHLFEDAGVPLGTWERWMFRAKMQERPRDRIRYCFRLATIPTPEDYALLPLPATPVLYSLLRPVRLAGEGAASWLRRHAPLDLGMFEPTPMELVGPMLALAEVGPADVVYDLGCGDGRLVIEAARRFGARGVGVDIDPRRISKARAHARNQGVDHLVKFIQQDAKTVDVSQATVVLLYLPWAGNIRLRQRLRQQLHPGARLVSRDTDMGGWLPDKTQPIEDSRGARSMLYLWRIETCPNEPHGGHAASPR